MGDWRSEAVILYFTEHESLVSTRPEHSVNTVLGGGMRSSTTQK